MKSSRIAISLPIPIASRVKEEALRRGVSLSRFLAGIVEDHYEDDDDNDCPCFSKAELERRLRSADDPKNCTEYETSEDFIKHMHEVANEIKNRKSL
ncbi:MAG: hypothetical protein LBI34_03205 [Puniceicoccales bacterium]|jgi:hypothetical protein|nr:hypothetical protein [Puniceicoccales bacterium]